MKRTDKKIERTVAIPNIGDVVIFATFEWVDNGIGPYEYFGFKGNDSQWEWELKQIDWFKNLHSSEENAKIESFVYSDQQVDVLYGLLDMTNLEADVYDWDDDNKDDDYWDDEPDDFY